MKPHECRTVLRVSILKLDSSKKIGRGHREPDMKPNECRKFPGAPGREVEVLEHEHKKLRGG